MPAGLLITVIATFGLGSLLAALNVKYRDFRYVVPFLVQFGLYFSPVGFSSSVVPDSWRLIYYLNPMAGVIDGFRWAILGPPAAIFLPGFCISMVMIILLAVTGVWYFRSTERAFADVI